MKEKIITCSSVGALIKEVQAGLKRERMKFTVSGTDKAVIVPMEGNVQNYRVFIYPDNDILMFLVPAYAKLQPDTPMAAKNKVMSKLLDLNDKKGIIKFSLDPKDGEVTLSAEVPWRDIAFKPKTVFTYLMLVVANAQKHQREILSLILQLSAEYDVTKKMP
jgi:hypothetical protein